MKLNELFAASVVADARDSVLMGMSNDSRMIQPGWLFIACPGVQTDGRAYIAQAQALGAAAIVYEPKSWPQGIALPQNIPCVAIENLQQQTAGLAARFYGYPTRHQYVTGVTGTNGKTSIAYQLAQAHTLLHHKAAYVGTLGQGMPALLQPVYNTTPDALTLQSLCADYLHQGIKHVCMEVSSHALVQQRVEGIDFDQAIFTNLTLDHLDYHKTMEAYAEAKSRLFAVESLQCAIINQDASHAEMMLKALKPSCQRITYGINASADVQALSWTLRSESTNLHIRSPWGEISMDLQALGFFNVYNTLAVFTSLMLAGYGLTEVQAIIPDLLPAPGRMEVVHRKPSVLVDYAHTPDALSNVLTTLRELTTGRLIVVFGCGGDRDRSKRPIMGQIASEYADVLVMTSDNPRTEDPLHILHEVAAGVDSHKNSLQEPDRKRAIRHALAMATDEDVVLVAGKGHETYQEVGKQRIAFSDKDVIEEFYSLT